MNFDIQSGDRVEPPGLEGSNVGNAKIWGLLQRHAKRGWTHIFEWWTSISSNGCCIQWEGHVWEICLKSKIGEVGALCSVRNVYALYLCSPDTVACLTDLGEGVFSSIISLSPCERVMSNKIPNNKKRLFSHGPMWPNQLCCGEDSQTAAAVWRWTILKALGQSFQGSNYCFLPVYIRANDTIHHGVRVATWFQNEAREENIFQGDDIAPATREAWLERGHPTIGQSLGHHDLSVASMFSDRVAHKQAWNCGRGGKRYWKHISSALRGEVFRTLTPGEKREAVWAAIARNWNNAASLRRCSRESKQQCFTIHSFRWLCIARAIARVSFAIRSGRMDSIHETKDQRVLSFHPCGIFQCWSMGSFVTSK